MSTHLNMAEIAYHKYADLFPMLHGEALDALREDIRAHGVRDPIVLHEGAILDGRNRFTCARDLGLEPQYEEFSGDDPLAYVISHNLHRRHLSESQRASVAARVANMTRGGDRRSDQAANLPDGSLSQQAAANMLNVSERSLRDAKKVHEHAPEEITRAVDDGRISVSLASKVADLPDEAKADVISAPPEEVKTAAREAVKKAHVAHNSGNNEWYTPEPFIAAARTVMGGIDLDPASSEIANQTVGASQIFTAEDDGLAQQWPDGRIWMNPPYAQPLMGQFADKYSLHMQRNKASCGIVLVNNATETKWFQNLLTVSDAVCFPQSRIKFLDPEGNATGAPLQGQAILYSGPNADDFQTVFSEFGAVLRHG